MTGKANQKIVKGREKSKIFIGPVKSPIAVIRRDEVAGYLTPEFWEYYECWKRLDVGMGLPDGPGWMQYPERFSNTLALFAGEWRALNGGDFK